MNKTLVAFCRAVHIYLTMLGMLVMLLFSVTGLTINHEEALGATEARVEEKSARLPSALLTPLDEPGIVAHLRETWNVRGALTNFTVLRDELALAFKAPGEVWDISIMRRSGEITARREKYGFTAIINNLHRGRYTGPAWSWIIDFSAVLIVLACLTGFVLWLALPKRRRLGIALLVLGTAATMAVIYYFVPGPDIGLTPESSPRAAREAG